MADVRAILARPTIYELFTARGRRARTEGTRSRARATPVGGPRVGSRLRAGGALALPGDVHYVGVDASEEYISRAKESFGTRAEFRLGDATMLDSDLREFDLVLAFGVLHHLDDSEAKRLLHHAQKALVSDGRFVASRGVRSG